MNRFSIFQATDMARNLLPAQLKKNLKVCSIRIQVVFSRYITDSIFELI